MYRILLLLVAFLTIANSCLHHSCSAAFKACDNHHNTQECWDWADETFNCCNECEKCDTSEKGSAPVALARGECHPQLCDTMYDVCNRMHPNSSVDCTAIADKASHCCYLCLSCPSVERAKFSKHHKNCDVEFCNTVYEHCSESNQNHSSAYCQLVADHASDCTGKCKDESISAKKDPKCHSHLCNAMMDVCTHHSDSPDCQYKADEASNCCYNCMDCPSGVVEKPANPPKKYDHCLTNLCHGAYDVCVKNEYQPDECAVVATEVSGCCSTIGNMCMDCPPPPPPPKKFDHCLSNLCNEVFNVCIKTEPHDECRIVADEVSDCCNMCGNCH